MYICIYVYMYIYMCIYISTCCCCDHDGCTIRGSHIHTSQLMYLAFSNYAGQVLKCSKSAKHFIIGWEFRACVCLSMYMRDRARKVVVATITMDTGVLFRARRANWPRHTGGDL